MVDSETVRGFGLFVGKAASYVQSARWAAEQGHEDLARKMIKAAVSDIRDAERRADLLRRQNPRFLELEHTVARWGNTLLSLANDRSPDPLALRSAMSIFGEINAEASNILADL